MVDLAEIEKNYQDLYGRAGETEGKNYWAGTGLTGSALTSAMKEAGKAYGPTYDVAGKTYNNPFAVTTPPVPAPTTPPIDYNEVVEKSYQDLFGRGSDPAGKQFWVSGLLSGSLTPEQLKSTMATSAVQGYGYEYDPNQGIYIPAKQEIPTKVTDVIPQQTTRYMPTYEETTAGQITGLLNKESPYVQAARAGGERAAHARGLLNSTIGAEAGQAAAIKAALPIAQQDAATYTQSGLQQQKFGEDASLIGLQSQYASQLSAQEAVQSMNQAKTLEEMAQAGTNYRLALEQEFKLQLAKMDLSGQEKNSFASQMTTLGDNFQAKIAGIQVDKDLSTEGKINAIESIRVIYESNLNNLSQIYGIDIVWSVPTTVMNEEEEIDLVQKAKDEHDLKLPTSGI